MRVGCFQERQDLLVTAYGHDRVIDKISVSLFDSSSNGNQNIENYCITVNNLELKDNNWVYAKPISENTPYYLHAFIPLQFADVIQKIDGQAMEKVIREIQHNVLVKALKNEDEIIQSKIFDRMTKRAVTMLKEDMECIGTVGQKESEDAKNEIVNIIRNLIECGEILSPYKEYENVKLDSK